MCLFYCPLEVASSYTIYIPRASYMQADAASWVRFSARVWQGYTLHILDAGLRTVAARLDTIQEAGLSRGAVKLNWMLVSGQVDWRLAGGWCVQGPLGYPFL